MRIVFSPAKRRPGCVLLQAAMGGTVPPGTFHLMFPAETWLLAPTDDMAAYPIDEEHSLEVLSEIAHESMRKTLAEKSGRCAADAMSAGGAEPERIGGIDAWRCPRCKTLAISPPVDGRCCMCDHVPRDEESR
jgi:hypothetical protein